MQVFPFKTRGARARNHHLRSPWLLLIAVLMSASVLAASFFQAPAPSGTDSQDVIQFLNQTIDWYRQLAAETQVASEPSGALVLNDDRQAADQVVRLAFDFARSQAEILAKQPAPNQAGNQSGPTAQFQALFQLSKKLDDQVRQTQGELQSLKQKLETATGRKRQELQSTIAETQSELELAQVRRDAIRSMLDFVSGPGSGTAGPSSLRTQIEALARTFPADVAGVSGNEQANAPARQAVTPVTQAASKAQTSGIWGLMGQVFELSGKIRTLKERTRKTEALMDSAKQLRLPLVNQLKSFSQKGDQLAIQADTADPATLAQQKADLDALTVQFKQISAATLPLSKAGILLGLYKTNLANWQAAVKAEYDTALKDLLIRLAALGVIVALVVGLAELWRKTILRYVHDARRRYQFLLLRKIVLWVAIAIVIAFAFASEIGSVATFAGLITAGVAVALQNVILSIVGYFFLIGRFGIRVGDRVQIAGVNGEVVDIGLVRLHLLELGSEAVDAPTGRVVAFSNSIVFQPTAGLFKQIPGTSFVWHEITLTVAPDGDYHVIEQRLLGAVESVFSNYRDEMERQRRNMERTLSSAPVDGLLPKSRLRITQAGLEVVIRYPVSLPRAAEVDDRVTRELLKEIDRSPKLKLLGSSTPSISIRTDLTPAPASR